MFRDMTYVAIGHFCHDVTPDGKIIGGAASYSTITARNLGATPRVVTSTGPDFNLENPLLHHIAIHSEISDSTTTFENTYDARGHRTQQILGVAARLHAEHVPETWRNADVAYLCPVADEVDESVARCFGDSLVGATPQGWMRRWDETGRVYSKRWQATEAFLNQIDVLVLSEEDIEAHPADLDLYVACTPLVVLTRGALGAFLFMEGKRSDSAAYPAEEVDPTGAGDVFAASFLLEYHRTNDPYLALDFAHCVASFAIQAEGTLGIPDREQVLRRWQKHHRL